MWDLICSSNMEHSHLDILEYSHSLMLKQGKIFESIQALILIQEIHKEQILPEETRKKMLEDSN